MNGPSASPRLKTIKIRSINRKPLKKKTALVTHLQPKNQITPIRPILINELQSPKYYNSSRHSIDNNLSTLSEKEGLNNKINSVNTASIKLNGSFNRSVLFVNQLTPQSRENISDASDPIKPRENVKSARLSHRNSISREKSAAPTIQEPNTPISTSNFPLKPSAVFKQYLQHITKFEQAELLDYSEVYYLGINSNKIKGDINEENYGYDDDRNDYKIVIGDHIAYRYEILSILGKGSFGQVIKCYDHKAKKHVAIKIIRNQKRFHRQGKVEIKVLQHIKTHDPNGQSHSVQMMDYFIFRKHICLIFEILNINLYELLKSNNFRGFSLSLVRRFIAQIISCLSFLRQNKIIHCDLKPENILLKEHNKSGIKVIDFGSSCFDNEKIYTYIQSRFYRAPEIMLGIEYTVAIDMWSLGCIAAELHSGYPLFAGESEYEQMLCIMEVLGLPPSNLLEVSTRKKLFFDGNTPKVVQNSRGKKRYPGTRKLEEKVRSNDENFLDFLRKCFEWNPKNRMTPEDAFNHEFIQEGIRNYNRLVKTSASSRTEDN
ncbi:hypothetical protein SteCoe_25062 [Stentor coeruleus]|uniref:dual-specificity kinase n=1 Tax=Stentor coeruleus TaxID=5963 RepID=A0A1R2BGG3_9CILI|nr:hypothetical protein SteCoe_25062 [Stentor coeruleus]